LARAREALTLGGRFGARICGERGDPGLEQGRRLVDVVALLPARSALKGALIGERRLVDVLGALLFALGGVGERGEEGYEELGDPGEGALRVLLDAQVAAAEARG
jgi:hypothetical protein